MKKIRVLIVDDSAIVRHTLAKELNNCSDIEVIATAPDPFVARDKILRLNPDVMTLDVEMPRMDGITFLKKIMTHHPIPTIVVSSLTPKGGEMAMEALNIGAVDVLCKPGVAYSIENTIEILKEQIRAASRVVLSKHEMAKSAPILSLSRTTNKVLALGASTGGTRAIEEILRVMPGNSPGIAVVQHMPPNFTHSFAERLNKICKIQVREAQDGDTLVTGTALIAPGNFHMEIHRVGGNYKVVLNQNPRMHFQRPAVDILFSSLAKYAGSNCVASILTGMGADGASGLKEIKKAGGKTIAQDQKTSVVWGMPGEAVKIGAAQYELPLKKIAEKMISLIQSG